MADLNLPKIKQEIATLLDLTKHFSAEKCQDNKIELSKKVPYLFMRSNTLFTKIINKDDISEVYSFLDRIEKIVKKESNVQKESEEVGQVMFEKYIKDRLPSTPEK